MAATRSDDGLLRIVLVVLAVVLLVPALMMLFAVPMMGMAGWWGGGMMGNGVSPLWTVGLTLVWLVVLVGIGYFLYRGLVGRADAGETTDRALEELRLAYARGDLSDEEYEERRERLRSED